jgi:hypothetical protein
MLPHDSFPADLAIHLETQRGLIPWGKPTTIRVGEPKIDEILFFDGKNPQEIRRKLRNDRGRNVLGNLLKNSREFDIRPGVAQFSWVAEMKPPELLTRVDQIDQLLGLLIEAHREAGMTQPASIQRAHPWKGLAEKLELRFRDTRPDGGLHLEGKRRGYRVLIETRGSGSSLRTRVQVLLQEEMPSGLRVLPMVDDLISAVPLHNPILDGRVAAFGRPPEQVRSLLNEDSVLPALMSVFEGVKGASVRDETLELNLPGVVDETDTLTLILDELMELALALDGAARAV